MRNLTPAVATLADTLSALGADDPLVVALAIHDGQCPACAAGRDTRDCDGVPTLEQHVLAQAFCAGLHLLAVQAPARVA